MVIAICIIVYDDHYRISWRQNCGYSGLGSIGSAHDRQKLKVTELKELLAKHNLPQTGKKDDLVKRALENNISLEGESEELVSRLSHC